MKKRLVWFPGFGIIWVMTRKEHAARVLAKAPGYKGDVYKTGCLSACLAEIGIGPDRFKFAQTCEDFQRIARRQGYSVKRVARNICAKDAEKLPIGFYLVYITGHVFYVFNSGNGIKIECDTAPDFGDRSNFHSVYRVTIKKV